MNHLRPSSPPLPRHSETGFSLIELMIAMTIGLFLTIGMLSLLASNSATRNEMEKGGRQIENGRYAIELLTDEIRHAGFYGEFGDRTSMPVPGTNPDPCLTPTSANLAALRESMFIHTQGHDTATGVPTGWTCALTGLKTDGTPKSDILVLRHASMLPSVATSAITGTTTAYLQTTPKEWKLDTNKAALNLTYLKGTTLVPGNIRPLQTNLFFIATQNGFPTLMRLELSGATFTAVPLVEGIENLQFEYGLDTNGDGSPDSYVEAGAAGLTTPAHWASVVSVRLFVLARNLDITAGWDDSINTYCLASFAGASGDCPNDMEYTPAAGDRFKRRVYTAVVRLNNPSGRKEQS